MPFREVELSHSRTLCSILPEGREQECSSGRGESGGVSRLGFLPDGLRHPGEATWVTSREIHQRQHRGRGTSSYRHCVLCACLSFRPHPSTIFPFPSLLSTSHFFMHPLFSLPSSSVLSSWGLRRAMPAAGLAGRQSLGADEEHCFQPGTHQDLIKRLRPYFIFPTSFMAPPALIIVVDKYQKNLKMENIIIKAFRIP